MALVARGARFAVLARLTIATNWSGAVSLKENHELIRRGPYANVRHPNYTALFAMGVGSLVEDGELSSLVLFVVAAAFFVVEMLRREVDV